MEMYAHRGMQRKITRGVHMRRDYFFVMLIICIILIWMVLKANRGYHEFLLYTPNLLSVAMVQSLSGERRVWEQSLDSLTVCETWNR